MKNVLLSILISTHCFVAIAQETDKDGKQTFPIEYFDEHWKPVQRKSDAKYYRTITPLNKLYLVKDYYLSGKLQMESYCSEVKPKLVHHGKTTWFYENGRIESEVTYEQGKRSGLYRSYYKNGAIKNEIIYKPERKEGLYCQFWKEDGTPLLSNGNGIIHVFENEYPGQQEFVDSVLTSAFFIRPFLSDTIYTIAEKPAEYEEGLPRLYQKLGIKLSGNYPKKARRMGVEGTVYIQFIVDKNGGIKEHFVLKGIGSDCDEAAHEAFGQLTEWQAATHHGKPVNFQYIIPIVFKLK